MSADKTPLHMQGGSGASVQQLQEEIARLQETNQRLAAQNMRLVLLNKEKDQRLYKAELVIRRYRTRLVRWFEDMVFDPLEAESLNA